MEYVRLGGTGLKVSRLALGCMSYGDPATPGAHTWALNDDDAQPYFRCQGLSRKAILEQVNASLAPGAISRTARPSTTSSSLSIHRSTNLWSKPSSASPKLVAPPWPKSRWPGC